VYFEVPASSTCLYFVHINDPNTLLMFAIILRLQAMIEGLRKESDNRRMLSKLNPRKTRFDHVIFSEMNPVHPGVNQV
jgi:hypothetical protein